MGVLALLAVLSVHAAGYDVEAGGDDDIEAGVRELLEGHDGNRDGKISKEELFAAAELSEDELQSNMDDFDRLLKMVDKDGDGLLDHDELAELIQVYEEQ